MTSSIHTCMTSWPRMGSTFSWHYACSRLNFLLYNRWFRNFVRLISFMLFHVFAMIVYYCCCLWLHHAACLWQRPRAFIAAVPSAWRAIQTAPWFAWPMSYGRTQSLGYSSNTGLLDSYKIKRFSIVMFIVTTKSQKSKYVITGYICGFTVEYCRCVILFFDVFWCLFYFVLICFNIFISFNTL